MVLEEEKDLHVVAIEVDRLMLKVEFLPFLKVESMLFRKDLLRVV